MGDHKLKRRMQTKTLEENANILETPFFFITPTCLYFFGGSALRFVIPIRSADNTASEISTE